MRSHSLPLATLLACVVWLGAAPAQSQAQVLKTEQWRQWMEAGRSTDLERAARARLAQQPGDGEAVAALAFTAIDLGDPKRLQGAVDTAQKCTEQQPQSALCQYALGSAMGVQAMQGGMLAGIRLAGRVKDSLTRAVELDPLLFDARQALMQFHLAAPAVAGGSMDTARELVAQAAQRQSEHARILRAYLHLKDGKTAEAESELRAVKTGADAELPGLLRQAWVSVGYNHRSAKRLPQARAVFDQVARDYPRSAMGPYGQARIAADMGNHDEAIALYERSRTLEGAMRLPIDHRQAQSFIAKGDKARGKELLQRFIAGSGERRPSPRNLEEAKKLLEELG